MSFKLGILTSHPIQYYTPWFRHLSRSMDVKVFYCHRQSAKEQAKAGFGVEFEWDTPLYEGYKYSWLNNIARSPNVNSFYGCNTPEIYKILKFEKYDAFLIFGWNYMSAIQTLHASWNNKIPVLMRGDSQLVPKRSRVKKIIKYLPFRIVLPRVHAHLFVGKRNKEYLKYFGVPDKKLYFAPHFVDNDFFSINTERIYKSNDHNKIRDDLQIPQDAFVVIYAGKLIEKKRPEDFIKASINIIENNNNINLHSIVMGDGPLRSGLQKLSLAIKDKIHFVGFINQNEITKYYSASNALILTSDGRETWGLVVNEAMACGVPVIVSDSAGCKPDLIDEGKTGLSFEEGNINQLTNRIIQLHRLIICNPNLVKISLIKKINTYSIENATNGLIQSIKSILYTKTNLNSSIINYFREN